MKAAFPSRKWIGRERPGRTCARAVSSLIRHMWTIPGGWRQRVREDSGATLVETAISMCLLILMLVGTFQLCLALYTYHYVSYTAREASRYAIVRGSTSCNNTPNLTNCNITADELQTWVRSVSYPGINPGNLTVTTTWPSTGSACYPVSSPCNNPSNLVNVVVKYAFPLNIPFWGSGTINIASTSQMVIAQ